jgi:hypothetical protein
LKERSLDAHLEELKGAITSGNYGEFNRLLDAKSKPVLDVVHARLCERLLTRDAYKKRLKNPLNTGKEMLNQSLSNLKLLLKSEDSVRRVFPKLCSINVKSEETGDYNDLLAMLLSDEDGKDFHKMLDEKFYHSNISKQTRDASKRVLCRAKVAEDVESNATSILYNLDALSSNERKEGF